MTAARVLFAVLCLGLTLACPPALEPDGGFDGGGDAGTGGGGGGGGGTYPPLDSISGAELTRLVTRLAADDLDGRNEGTDGGAEARAYIIQQLTACGVQPAGTVGFEQSLAPNPGANILGRVTGTDATLRDRVLVVSAHYDHLGHCGGAICNGAGDNAAAVAQIIGVGCALARLPPARSVLIASWDAEEPPAFLTGRMGSEYWAAHPTVPLASVDAALVLDLTGLNMWTGYQGHVLLGAEFSDGLAAAVDGALASPPPIGALKPLRGGLHLAEETIGGRQPWSDYHAFRNRSIPFLFLSDGQNTRYHTGSDEVAFLDLPKLEAEARLLLELVWRLANAPTTPAWKPNGTSPLQDAQATVSVLQAAVAPSGLVDALQLGNSSRTKLQADLTAAQGVLTRTQAGTAQTTSDVRVLRSAVQRVMCHAGGSYSEPFCNAL